MMTRQRMAGYARVSQVGARGREEGGVRFMSVEVQREIIARWGRAHDVSIRWFEELDASGGDSKRVQWNRALEACERGELAGIVCARLDRFARSTKDALDALERLDRAGARLVSIEESLDDSTVMGRFARDLLLRLAQMERERSAETWALAATRAVDDGIHVATAPRGYLRPRHRNGRPKREPLIPDPDVAPKIVEAFRMRADGATLRSIARHMNASISGIKTMLANEAYLGVAKGPLGLRRPGSHPALVSGELWHSAQGRDRRQPQLRDPSVEGILMGTARCASCGNRLRLSVCHSYLCGTIHAGTPCRAPTGIKIHKLDTHVLSLIDRAAADPTDLHHDLVVDHARTEASYFQATLELARAERHLDQWLELNIDAVGHARWHDQLDARQQAVYLAEDRLDVLGKVPTRPPQAQLVSVLHAEIVDARVRMKDLFTGVYVEREPRVGQRGSQPVGERVTVSWRD